MQEQRVQVRLFQEVSKGFEKPELRPAKMLAKGQQNSDSHHHRFKPSSISTHKMVLDQEDASPPLSPLRSPALSSSSSSSSQNSQMSNFDPLDFDPQQQCNSKEERSTYNTKFARYHIETFKQNDRLRWNFDFDHNRPLDVNNHHIQQWEPAI